MTSLLSLVVLAIIAYTGAVIFQRISFKNIILKNIAYTGVLYIILGYVLSPNVLNVFNKTISEHLNIIFSLVLGWVGFLIGLQTKFTALKRFPFKYYRYSIINFISTYLITVLILYAVNYYFLSNKIDIYVVLILSLAGSVTSPIMLAVIIRDNRVKARLAHMLQFNAAFDNLLGVFFIGIIFVIAAFVNRETVINILLKGFIVLLTAGLSGYIYKFLADDKINEEESFLYILGLLMFNVGITLYLGLSLLLTTLIFGMVIANTTPIRRKLYHTVQQIEKPMYLLLLIYTGIQLNFSNQWPILLTFLIAHILSKIAAENIANISLDAQDKNFGLMGVANIGMGGLSLAIVLDSFIIQSVQMTEGILLFVVVSLFINDGIALKYLQKKLVNK